MSETVDAAVSIVVLEDDQPEYVYEVNWPSVVTEVAAVHGVDRQTAENMLLKSSMEHPVQGRRCKFWREQ